MLSDDRFGVIFDELHGECGNRLRRHEAEALFRGSGFRIERVVVSRVADRRYAKTCDGSTTSGTRVAIS